MITKLKSSLPSTPFFLSPVLLSAALLLSACGGGSGTSTSSQTTTESTQPNQVVSSDWQDTDVLARRQNGNMRMSMQGSKLHISINNMWPKRSGKHIQVFLDIDNNPATGFRSRYNLWSQSGIDYLIQDGRIYKSQSNSSRWRWKRLDTPVNYSHDGNNISFDIEAAELDGLCNSFTAGYMSRYRNWFIHSIYPVARTLKSYRVSSCSNSVDNVAPVISLNGANPLTLALNATFNDPGATASDNVDGDISSAIETHSTVNTAVAGRYEVLYKVTDSSGNSTEKKRVVIVSEAVTPGNIVIDGNADDWAAIQPLAQTANGTLKVFDDENKLYILVEASQVGANTQIFLDSDNNAQTGFQLNTQAWDGGADYLIENQSLGRSIGNNTQWAWNFNLPANIEIAKTSNIVEYAIKKADITPLGNTLSIGYMSRNANWNINYVLPATQLSIYPLLHPGTTVNQAPTANNDHATTESNTAVNINVLNNDSDVDGDTLTISQVGTPVHGTATISGTNQIRYTPQNGFSGNDSFTYTINDGHGHTATASVNVSISPPANHAPVANNDRASTLTATAIIVNVLTNDTDTDSDTLSITHVGAAQHGVAAISSAKITYTPISGFTGTDSFNYTISDGRGGNSTATVTITVTAPPVNHAPDAVEDAPSTNFTEAITIDVLANDTDPDGDTLTVTSITQPTFGTTVLNADGTVTFDPQGNIGSITFSYTISDGRGGTDSTVVTIASSDPNDGNNAFPDIVDDHVTTKVNTPITIDVLANDSDADGDVLVLDQVDGGSHGTTTKVNGKVLYTPVAGFTGTDSFYYGVHDGHGHNGSGLVTVTVTPSTPQ